MKPIYTKQEIEEIAKRLGFAYVVRFQGFLGNDYDLLDDREDGLEDRVLIFEADKEYYASKINALKKAFDFNPPASTEEQILKVIAIIKQFNVDYLLEKYQGQIDEETAERLVEYGYTHGNCTSLASTLDKLFFGCNIKKFKGGSYGHLVIEYKGKIFDITGYSTLEEMKQFVAREGGVSPESCTVNDVQQHSNAGPLITLRQNLIDYAITQIIGKDILQWRKQPKILLGERVEKTEENKVGWEDKSLADKIDSSKPIVICLPGSATSYSAHANGMCKSIEGMLGISDFAPEDKPCKIYGLYYENIPGLPEKTYFDMKANGENPDITLFKPRIQESVKAIEKFAEQLVESVFKPLVQDENGKIYKPMEIARRFRNVHFVSFCFGSVIQSAINQELRKYLLSTGLNLESIEKLESQICVLQTAPIVSETKTNQTIVNFISLADDETIDKPIESKALNDYRELQNQSLIGGVFQSPNNNPTIYVKEFTTRQDEEHNGGFYLHFLDEWSSGRNSATYQEKVGGVLPLCTAICLRRAMQNAVSNAGTSKYVPLRVDDVVKPCGKYLDWANHHPQDIPQTLLEIYNRRVNYATTNLIETLER